MVLRDAIEISRVPERIFQFFEDMEAHYLHWHPDHRVFRWTSGRGLAVGNTFHFEELIAGKLLKKNVMFTRIDSHSHIEFAPTFWLMRVFLPRILFRIEAAGPGVCRVVAEIHLRMGPLAARLNKRELDAVREHMRIEGINLKRILEGQVQSHQEKLPATSMEHVTFPVLDQECTRVETHEVIEVERDASGALRLLHSPAMVAGIARGDVVAMDSSSLCGYRLIQRGGMLAAVMMFVSGEQRRDAERLLGLEVQSVGGVCEGGPGRALVFSLPVAAGFGVVEEFLGGAAARFDGAQWFFGNVFGPDGQPLNWWL